MRRLGTLPRGICFGGRDVKSKAEGDIVKTQEEHTHTARGSDHRSDEASDLGIERPAADREAIDRLAYLYWEERGCPNDSPDEDWFRAEAELRQQLADAASS
jgi:Protein of unknown function (DUF2934)